MNKSVPQECGDGDVPAAPLRSDSPATNPAMAWWSGFLSSLLARLECRRQRRALYRLSDDLLKDIGLSRADVERECRKGSWWD